MSVPRKREVPPCAKSQQTRPATKERIGPPTGPNGESGPEAER
jgi:hypothetical protein